MSCLASAGVAETEDGAVERMRMVLFSFTNAYYTKKLPRNLPRNLPRMAFQTPENWSDRNSGVWNLNLPRNLPRSSTQTAAVRLRRGRNPICTPAMASALRTTFGRGICANCRVHKVSATRRQPVGKWPKNEGSIVSL